MARCFSWQYDLRHCHTIKYSRKHMNFKHMNFILKARSSLFGCGYMTFIYFPLHFVFLHRWNLSSILWIYENHFDLLFAIWYCMTDIFWALKGSHTWLDNCKAYFLLVKQINYIQDVDCYINFDDLVSFANWFKYFLCH